MRWFESFEAVARFSTAHDELHDYFRSRRAVEEAVSLAAQYQLFRDRWAALMRLLEPVMNLPPSRMRQGSVRSGSDRWMARDRHPLPSS